MKRCVTPASATNRTLLWSAALCSAAILALPLRAATFEADADGKGSESRKIVLIAGPITGHPKDTHEYEKSVVLLKHLLDRAPNLRGLLVEAHFGGWPRDESTLDDADSIVLISDGGDRNEESHPLYVGNRMETIARQMNRGCGFVNFHWTTFHPAREHDRITEWVGGYFDYETGPAPRKWYSAIETKEWPVALPSPRHPIARGVRPFRVREEFYYRIRFRDVDPRLVPLAAVADGREGVVGWAVERDDGGRGFGFTGGHFYANWWNTDFRRFILNAIVWSSGAEVPPGGVESNLEERFRTLVVTGHNHPAHDWRSVTEALIGVIEQDPRAIVHVTENPERLGESGLEAYRTLVFNYSNWERPGLSDRAKKGLVDYLSSGGGLTVVHFANGAFHYSLPRKDSDWEEYRTRIVRRVWVHGEGKSGHDPYGPFRVEIADVEHEVTRGLESFDTVDELYFRQEGPLPVVPLANARSKVTGNVEPLAWTYDYGRGRVFQTLLGHAAESVRRAGALIRRGTVWSARSSPLGFDPPPEIVEGMLFRAGSPWTAAESRARAEANEAKGEEPVREKADEPAEDGSESAGGDKSASEGVLPPNPGLDGGLGGHWGIKNDGDWKDGRWNQMDVGSLVSSSLRTPAGLALKSLALRLGDDASAAAAFDTADLAYRVAWTGEFISFDPQRFGVIAMPRIAGTIELIGAEGKAWGDAATRYRRLYRGARPVLEYEVNGIRIRDAPWADHLGELRAFTRDFAVAPRDRSLATVLCTGTAAAKLNSRHFQRALVPAKGDHVNAIALLGAEAAEAWLRVDGPKVILEFGPATKPTSCRVVLARVPRAGVDEFFRSAAELSRPSPSTAIAAAMMPSRPRWKTLKTSGRLGAGSGAYVIDTIDLPLENPYRALFFLSGHDFFRDGRAAVSTLHGDVWIASGLDADLGEIEWRRFATGLYQPLGLKIVRDEVYVRGRDQITRLSDRNGDGEADLYEAFSHTTKTTANGHDYVSSLETDASGNFYYVSPRGLHRVAPDGSSEQVIATGWRNPNGLSVSAEGVITVAPQEGEWTPASQIVEVKLGGYYGYPGPRPDVSRPRGYDLPLCYLPRGVDNSTGGQVWVERVDWGPLSGQLLSFSFGTSSMQLILRDRVGDQPQGAVVKLDGRFRSGAMRGRFHPRTGDLYVSGMQGWVTNAVEDGCLERVRYTGAPLALPTDYRVHENGLWLRFSEPLDAATAGDAGSYRLEAWNYEYAKTYGSKEYSARHPKREGHDPVSLRSVRVFDGGREIFLEVPALEPVDQLSVSAFLDAADGRDASIDLVATVHALHPPFELEPAPAPGATGARPTAEAGSRDDARSGLELTLRPLAGGEPDHRRARRAALFVGAGESPSPFIEPGPFLAVFRGELVLPQRDKVRFRVRGSGRAQLELDGRVVFESESDESSRLAEGWSPPVRVRAGRTAIVLSYRSPDRGDATLRLYWEGREFREETVSAEFLSHSPSLDLRRAERVRRGRELVARHRCLDCHRADAAELRRGMPELSFGGPTLDGIGSRLREEWLARWIEHPARERPGATMPRVLAPRGVLDDVSPTATVSIDRRALDIAAYLSTLRAEVTRRHGGAPPRASARAGGDLFARLGCFACHTFDSDTADGELTPLTHVAAKWQPGALREYLLEPHSHFPATRMPDFDLSGAEADQLAAFLLARTAASPVGDRQPPIRVPASALRGDRERGRSLAEANGCANCHEIPGVAPQPAAPFEKIARLDWSKRGCAAPPSTRRSAAPRLELGDRDRRAIAQFGRHAHSLFRRSMAEAAERTVRGFACTACHARDGEAARWDEREAAFEHLRIPRESRISVQTRPALSFFGEQLRVQWIARLLGGDLGYRLRPWLDARMPSFGPLAASLADGFAHADGFSARPRPQRSATSAARDSAREGKTLLGSASGLSCTSCHPVGSRPAENDLHFGVVNLAHSAERLRPEFFRRWMLNPQRIAPGTAMPAYADRDGLSVLASAFEGDAERQFAAIWAYLCDRPETPDAGGGESGPAPESAR